MGCCSKKKTSSSEEYINILMVGLVGAGKTSILYRIKNEEKVISIPGSEFETLGFQGLIITAFDTGVKDIIRSLWKLFYRGTDGLIFVVDSNDRDRLENAAEELENIVDLLENVFCPILIFANKQDLNSSFGPK